MGINEVQARSILQKSNLPDADYVINPYTGCVHGCVYCYARFIKRFTGHTETWGAFLDAKVNAPALLRRELEKRRTPLRQEVFFSSVTDPYQAAESRYQLTRGLLEVLVERQVPVSILTKSDLVLRDLDLFMRFDHCRVGLSLMTTDDTLAHWMEPRAPSPTRRIQALKTLKENGIRTYAFISPYLPTLSGLKQIIESLHSCIDEIGVEAINTSGGNWGGVEEALSKFDPASLPACRRLSKDEPYWTGIEQQARTLADQYHLDFMGFYRH